MVVNGKKYKKNSQWTYGHDGNVNIKKKENLILTTVVTVISVVTLTNAVTVTSVVTLTSVVIRWPNGIMSTILTSVR